MANEIIPGATKSTASANNVAEVEKKWTRHQNPSRGFVESIKPDPDVTDLMRAAQRADLREISQAIEEPQGPIGRLLRLFGQGSIVDATDSRGDSALIHAIHSNNGPVFKTLLDKSNKAHKPAVLEKLVLRAAKYGADVIIRVISSQGLLDPKSELAERALAITSYKANDYGNKLLAEIGARIRAEQNGKKENRKVDINNEPPATEKEMRLADLNDRYRGISEYLISIGVQSRAMSENQMFLGERAALRIAA